MKRNVLTAPVLKTVRWGLMCLALCLASMPANADDEMANTLVYAGENEDTINPLLNNHQELPTIIFSGLMKYDAKGQPVPELAEGFTYDKGTHTYAFKLRDGVKWHDGKPLTVEDILFTYEALTKDKTLASSITSNYEDIKSITAPDAQTVIFTLSKPNAAMLDNFTIGILPKHLFAGKDINTAPANQHPVGTGRYKFVEWDTAGGMIILEKNKDYYGGGVKIAGREFKHAIGAEPTEENTFGSITVDLSGMEAESFVASIGSDYPLGGEEYKRYMVSQRKRGKSARFATVIEPHEDEPKVAYVSAEDENTLVVEMRDGTQRIVRVSGLDAPHDEKIGVRVESVSNGEIIGAEESE